VSLAPFVHLDERLDAVRAGDTVVLPADAVHHLDRVLRLRPGAEVVVADGHGSQASGTLDEGRVLLTRDPRHDPPPEPVLTVAQGLAKGRKVDEVVRQVTELGVDRIVPVAADRSVVQLTGDRAARAVARWDAVARAASEQARRPRRPTVAAVTPTRQLPELAAPGRLLVAHPDGGRSLVDAARDAGRLAVTVAVGPEGGWSDDEVAALAAAGAEVVGLGPSVLRTEHAAPAAVAVLAAVTGRWG
jgi:16S rRNA (uracil1498-N3)-methyltransferase